MPSMFMFLRICAAISVNMKCLPGLWSKCPRSVACKMFGLERTMKCELAGWKKMDSILYLNISFISSGRYLYLWMGLHYLKDSACGLRVARKMPAFVRSRLMRHLVRANLLRNIGLVHCGLWDHQYMCPNMRYSLLHQTERSPRFASSGQIKLTKSGISSRLAHIQIFSGWAWGRVCFSK